VGDLKGEGIDVYDDFYDRNYKVTVNARDVVHRGDKYHEIVQKFIMDSLPEDYMYFRIFMNEDIRRKIDSSIESFDLMYFIKKNNVNYFWMRLLTKKVLMMKGKEVLIMCAFKKMDDGSFMEVFKSWEHPDYPIQDYKPRMEIIRGAIVYKKTRGIDGNIEWECTDYRFVNPQVSVGVKLLKPILQKQFKGIYVNGFKEINKFMEEGSRDDWREYLDLAKKRFENKI